MKNLTQHIQEKLQISRNRQHDYADDITVSNLVKLIYNYGPDFDIKDAFGRRKVKVLPTAEVSENETEVLGKDIYKITFSGGAAWKNIPSFITVWTWHAPQGKDSITCYEGEDEKLQSLFKPEILDEMIIFLKKHSKVQEKLQISRNKKQSNFPDGEVVSSTLEDFLWWNIYQNDYHIHNLEDLDPVELYMMPYAVPGKPNYNINRDGTDEHIAYDVTSLFVKHQADYIDITICKSTIGDDIWAHYFEIDGYKFCYDCLKKYNPDDE